MNVIEACKLIEKYAKCPCCGCELIGDGKGTLEITEDFLKRTCHCGMHAIVNVSTEKGGAE